VLSATPPSRQQRVPQSIFERVLSTESNQCQVNNSKYEQLPDQSSGEIIPVRCHRAARSICIHFRPACDDAPEYRRAKQLRSMPATGSTILVEDHFDSPSDLRQVRLSFKKLSGRLLLVRSRAGGANEILPDCLTNIGAGHRVVTARPPRHVNWLTKGR